MMAPNAMDLMVGRGLSKKDVCALDVQLHEQKPVRRQHGRLDQLLRSARHLLLSIAL